MRVLAKMLGVPSSSQDRSVGLSDLRIIKKREVELIIPKLLLIKKLLFYGFY